MALHVSTVEKAPDPLLPWLRYIHGAHLRYRSNPQNAEMEAHLKHILADCIATFSGDPRYRNDPRLLKIWIIHGDMTKDFETVFQFLEGEGTFQCHSLLYEACALVMIEKGNLLGADKVYELGISRNAEPLDRLKKMHRIFLKRMSEIVQSAAHASKINEVIPQDLEQVYVDPWSISTINDLLKKMDSNMKSYKGFYRTNKAYSGKVALTSLKSSSRNKILELGGIKYQITGCSGSGGFAQIFRALVDGNPKDVVALKIQKPAFAWEFYMYRQLDKYISDIERSFFGFAHEVHIYSDWSVLICDYLNYGTLQDAINSYVVTCKPMEETLCMFYTIEMLQMLEFVHRVGIIHGDFKADNLLVRNSRDELTEGGFSNRTGPWRDQGLCLVDWGKGIDTSLFPAGTQFQGDSRTSGYRCIEMLEGRAWTYQVDYYALCVNVHMMLHGAYMAIEKKVYSDGSIHYQPKLPFRRYWNVDLWKSLFSTLLNAHPDDKGVFLLRALRESFENYINENPKLINKLKNSLMKQKTSLCFT